MKWLISLSALFVCSVHAADADLILHNGKVLTVDGKFSIAQAIAVKNGRITSVGTNEQVMRSERGARTRLMDLGGKTVLPGLIDAHVHTLGAGLSEFRKPLPPLDSIAAIQDYIRKQAKETPKGEWIIVPRTLPPRLKEMRMPTRQDLDVTTDHPVAFDGSYVWSANTLALKISGITKDTPNPPGGEVVKGPDGEPNGILRNASQLLKGARRAETFSDEEKLRAVEKMLHLYAAAGLTAVGDRAVTQEDVGVYEKLKAQNKLPVRVILTWRPGASGPAEDLIRKIRASSWTTNKGDEWLKFGTFKITLDGGQSVGTAFQRMPYGPFGRQLYGQTNPDSRGTLFVDAEKLYRIYSAAQAKGWQLTAHAQGGGAIDTLLDVFERLNREKPIAPMRHHVMHGSFMSEEALDRMKRMGVIIDAQPGWLHYDVPALQKVFGRDKMRWFFPLRSFFDKGIVVAGGSDHMIGYGKDNAVNPYNPFFNIWMCVTRRTSAGEVFYPEERVTREQALRMYTTGAAYLQFSEKSRGSLEVGKLADLVVIDRDFLNCPEDELKDIQPLLTMVEGRVIYERK
jgi:Predicted metal-dependent hydrolase with the TIM-barrel fold